MKLKCTILILGVIFCSQCRNKENGIVHTHENGIEVVSNPMKSPAKAKIRFEFERSLLSNDPGIPVDISFGRIFYVDDNGYLYLCDAKNTSIFIFNAQGKYLKQFGGQGEGPGFFMAVKDIFISKEDIGILEESRISYFSKDGSFLRQTKLLFNEAELILPNGNIISNTAVQNPDKPTDIKFQLVLNAPDRKAIQTLDKVTMFNPQGSSIKGINYSLNVAHSKDILFVYSQDRQYEIFVYNFSGHLFRRIKKAYQPVPVSAEYKNDFISEIKPLYDLLKDKLYFPEYMPPIHCLFADEDGFLFVVTYEKSQEQDGYVIDIFNPLGEYIANTVMPLDSLVQPMTIKLRNKHIYRIYHRADVEELTIFRYSIEK